MELSADVIGRRVTVRHRDGNNARDVVGRVLDVTDAVTVERRDGTTAQVPLDAVIVWRVVPDRPVRSRRATAVDPEVLARITSLGWPAIESEQVGDWELRASSGFTGRANSALVVGSPGMDLDEAIDRVVTFYSERALPPTVQVITGSTAESRFVERDWRPLDGPRSGAVVQVANLAATYAPDSQVAMSMTLSDEWMSRYPRVSPAHSSIAHQVLAGPNRVGFASIGTPPIGIGRVVATGEWAGLAAVEVDPGHRRRGLARRIVSTMLSWALSQGADKAYLQVSGANAAAFALYEPFGFSTHHEYRYLTR